MAPRGRIELPDPGRQPGMLSHYINEGYFIILFVPKNLVAEGGFEPPTTELSAQRSTPELLGNALTS